MSELSGYLEETGQAEPETSPEPEPEAPAAAETAEPDPVADYVAKYGGDTEKALRAAVEAQSLIGRQGTELGQLRQEMQSWREQLTPQQEQQDPFPSQDEGLSWAQEIGYSENWKEGAQWALENNSPLYDTIMEGAYEQNKRDATRFEMLQAQNFQRQQILDQIGPTIAPMVASSHQAQFTQAWNGLKTSLPDIDEMSTGMMQVAQSRPGVVEALKNQDPEVQRQVISDLYWIAKGEASAPLQTAAGQAAQAAAADAQQLRSVASVGTATASAPVEPPSDETPAMQEWRSALSEELGLNRE